MAKEEEVLPPGVLSASQKKILLFLQIALAAIFVLYGVANLVAVPQIVQAYRTAGWGNEIRIATALVGFVGAALVVAPRTAFWGGLVLSLLTIESILLSIAIKLPPLLPLIQLWATLTITWFRRPKA